MSNYTWRVHRTLGIELKITLPNGEVITVYEPEGTNLDKAVKQYVRDYLNKDDRYIATNPRTRTYKELRNRGRIDRQYTERDIRALTSKAYKAAIGGAVLGYVRTMSSIAEELLENEMLRAKFNSYTGNLYNSYKASVISNGKLTSVVTPKQTKKGSVHYGRFGGRYSPVLGGKNHPIKASHFKKNGVHIRYLKKREKDPSENGYLDISFTNRFGGRTKGTKGKAMIGNLQEISPKRGVEGKRNSLLRTGIIVENAAPYSAAVNRRYNVLKHATERSAKSKYEAKGVSLIRVASQKIIKEAGFSIKRTKK